MKAWNYPVVKGFYKETNNLITIYNYKVYCVHT